MDGGGSFPCRQPGQRLVQRQPSNSEQILGAREFLICWGSRWRGCLWSRSAGWLFAPRAALSRGKRQSATQTGGSAGVTL